MQTAKHKEAIFKDLNFRYESVGMQACRDVMIVIGQYGRTVHKVIVQHGRSVHKLSPAFLWAKGDSYFPSCFIII